MRLTSLIILHMLEEFQFDLANTIVYCINTPFYLIKEIEKTHLVGL